MNKLDTPAEKMRCYEVIYIKTSPPKYVLRFPTRNIVDDISPTFKPTG